MTGRIRGVKKLKIDVLLNKATSFRPALVLPTASRNKNKTKKFEKALYSF